MDGETPRPRGQTFDRWLRWIQVLLATFIAIGLITRGGLSEVVGYAGLAVLILWAALTIKEATKPS